MYHRGFRGSRRRSTPRAAINTYKKVLHFINAGFSAGFQNTFIIQGKDGINPSQATATDGEVPTGSTVKFIEVQFAISNLVSTPCYINCTLQYKLKGQFFIEPNKVGGDAQRNQVLHMELFSVGANQNSNHKFKFKIPKQFQRVRDDMDWSLTWQNSATVNREIQVIYKFQH